MEIFTNDLNALIEKYKGIDSPDARNMIAILYFIKGFLADNQISLLAWAVSDIVRKYMLSKDFIKQYSEWLDKG